MIGELSPALFEEQRSAFLSRHIPANTARLRFSDQSELTHISSLSRHLHKRRALITIPTIEDVRFCFSSTITRTVPRLTFYPVWLQTLRCFFVLRKRSQQSNFSCTMIPAPSDPARR